jgi:hypothetical protein
MTLARSDRASRFRTLDKLSGSQEHTSAVQDYFIAAGLPADQIGEVKPYAHLRGTNKRVPDESDVMYRYGVLFRQYNGIRVEDSMAWARLNVEGDSVTESVYWPEIPAPIIATANAFAALLADPAGRTAYVQQLPAGAATALGRLVIHHSPGIYLRAFAAAAVFDVSVDGHIVHYGLDGRVVVLPHEVPDPIPPSSPKPGSP